MSDDQTQVYLTESRQEVIDITDISIALVDLKHFIGNAIIGITGILWIIRTIQLYPVAQHEFIVSSVKAATNAAPLLKLETDILVHHAVALHCTFLGFVQSHHIPQKVIR